MNSVKNLLTSTNNEAQWSEMVGAVNHSFTEELNVEHVVTIKDNEPNVIMPRIGRAMNK